MGELHSDQWPLQPPSVFYSEYTSIQASSPSNMTDGGRKAWTEQRIGAALVLFTPSTRLRYLVQHRYESGGSLDLGYWLGTGYSMRHARHGLIIR